jgi:predicted dehydrogenase
MVARLRVGMVGAGWVSAHHLRAWRSTDDVDVIAIADVDRARAERRASEFVISKVRASAAEMLASDRLDALDIATPMEAHVDDCLAAASHGVAMLCQKPLAPSLAEARSLVEAVAGRARLMVNENWRFRPHYRQVKRWLDEGVVGAPREMRLTVRSSGLIADASGTRPALARQPFLGLLKRFVIGELLIHHLDVARWLLGPLQLIAVSATRGIVEGEHAATIRLLSHTGCAVVVEGDMAAPGAPPLPVDALDLTGHSGSIRMRAGDLTLAGLRRVTHRFDLIGDYQQAYNNAALHFVDCLHSGLPFETEASDNLQTLALVEAAYASLGADK